MKNKILLVVLVSIATVCTTGAQEKYDDLVKVGDELVIKSPSRNNYRYIAVPKKNFIIKRGGIANLSSLHNNKVTVTKIAKNSHQTTIVTFKRSNGTKFFNAFRKLKANLNGAINSNELELPKASKKGSLAK